MNIPKYIEKDHNFIECYPFKKDKMLRRNFNHYSYYKCINCKIIVSKIGKDDYIEIYNYNNNLDSYGNIKIITENSGFISCQQNIIKSIIE